MVVATKSLFLLRAICFGLQKPHRLYPTMMNYMYDMGLPSFPASSESQTRNLTWSLSSRVANSGSSEANAGAKPLLESTSASPAPPPPALLSPPALRNRFSCRGFTWEAVAHFLACCNHCERDTVPCRGPAAESRCTCSCTHRHMCGTAGRLHSHAACTAARHHCRGVRTDWM